MNILYLTILAPLIGFLLLAFSQGRWSENVSATVGIMSVGVAALTTILALVDFRFIQAKQNVYDHPLWTWINVFDFKINFSLYVDGLSITMLSIVVGVGLLIHIYASWYMRGEEGYSRFFAYTNLFIASMVVLVLGDNLLVLYLGWEGVGLCSYLLIGFYYKNAKNGTAAMKAFFVTRLGDVFLAIGLFMLYTQLGTLNIREILTIAPAKLPQDSVTVFWATLMIFGGAVGKSAQLPLQTWLADAMAGPTPVSALIHAATMVTAGVYLVARMHGIFVLSTSVMTIISTIGALTLLIAGCCALVQNDIKRVLAYSTMSQLGYMFLALGVQAWDAAIFHLMTHAFFKALLFLSAGSVIIACHHEQNIKLMGGLYRKIPFVYACFLVGGGALAALPWVTAGFYSKDTILWSTYAQGYPILTAVGIIGAFLTSLYTFRLIMLVFHGEPKSSAHSVKGSTHTLPLSVLLVLSTCVGAMITLPLKTVFPEFPTHISHEGKLVIEVISASVAVIGVVIAIWCYCGDRKVVKGITVSAFGKILIPLWVNGCGFDWLYNKVIVRPYLWIATLLRRDPVSYTLDKVAPISRFVGECLAFSQNGLIRWYASSMIIGALIILALLLLG